MKSIWLVVGEPLPLSHSDAVLRTHLAGLGARVLVVRDVEFAMQKSSRTWPGVGAAVISGSCRDDFLHGSASLAANPRGTGPALPLLLFHASSCVPLGLSRKPHWVRAGAVRLSDAAHHISTGIQRGYVPMYESPGQILVASVCGAHVIAHPPLSTSWGEGTVVTYEEGSQLCDGSVASARRVVFGIDPTAIAGELSIQATSMLSSALVWLTGASLVDTNVRQMLLLSRVCLRCCRATQSLPLHEAHSD